MKADLPTNFLLTQGRTRLALALLLIALLLAVDLLRWEITGWLGGLLSTLIAIWKQSEWGLLRLLAKWIDTLLYAFLHSLLVLGIVGLVFYKRSYTRFAAYALAFMMGACLLTVLAYKAWKTDALYKISEDFIFAMLSPLPLLLLGGFFKLAELLGEASPEEKSS